MENLWVTPGEVIELAFCPPDQIDPAVITDSRIEAAQLKFLAPVLGKLYTALANGKHTDYLREFMKPALAHFVRYHILLHVATRIGNDGIMRVKFPESDPADNGEIDRLQAEARRTANLFLKKALDHLREHEEEFPEFGSGKNPRRQVGINGGIVL